MSRGFLTQKAEQAQRRTVQECRASMVGQRTQGMYLPQRRESAIDLETLPDLKLRLGLCARSGGNLSVCRQCGAPCSFGRILMERQDNVSQATGAEVNSNVVPDGRKKQAKPATDKPQSRATTPNVAQDGRQKAVKPPKMTHEEYLAHRREYMRRYTADPEHREKVLAQKRESMRKSRERKKADGEAERIAQQQAEVERLRLEAERDGQDLYHTFAARLRYAIALKGWSLTETAKKLDATFASISAYCNTRNLPTVTTLHEICKLLGVSADWLMGLEERP